ncbi:epithelial sodium channel subunit alpha-like isoform X2 [Tachypleus tridentatus]|uniref:epithelial sodium channel subunit alpha-like isoform X2 n=1 Tax=Tachypleus tridentatus TaxID=6853 RepID=UPI003FD63E91
MASSPSRLWYLRDSTLGPQGKEDTTGPLARWKNAIEFLQTHQTQRQARRLFHRRAWQWVLRAIICAVAVTGFIFETYLFLKHYFEYSVVVNLNVENEWKLDFPAVTVCNLNRLRRSAFHENEGKCQEKYNITEKQCRNMILMDNLILNGFWMETSKYVYFSGDVRKKYASCHVSNKDTLSKKRITLQEFINEYAKLTDLARKELGHSAEKLIIGCTFEGVTCSPMNFTRFSSFEYGNCYTFNSALNEYNYTFSPIVSRSVGSFSGLSLELNLESYDYLYSTPSVGARVVIHDPREQPMAEYHGLDISPGFETSVALKKNTIHRLPAPYQDNCKEYNFNAGENGLNTDQEDCIRHCIQTITVASCDCGDPTLPLDGISRPCDISNQTQVCCLDDVLEYFKNNRLSCDCPLPCVKDIIDTSLSMAEWPSPAEFIHIAKEISKADSKNLQFSTWEQSLSYRDIFREVKCLVILEELWDSGWEFLFLQLSSGQKAFVFS